MRFWKGLANIGTFVREGCVGAIWILTTEIRAKLSVRIGRTILKSVLFVFALFCFVFLFFYWVYVNVDLN